MSTVASSSIRKNSDLIVGFLLIGLGSVGLSISLHPTLWDASFSDGTEAERVATLGVNEDAVRLRPSRTPAWKDLSVGAHDIFVGDHIFTGTSGKAELQFGPELEVQLDPGSLIVVDRLDRGGAIGEPALKIVEGTVRLKVAHAGFSKTRVQVGNKEYQVDGADKGGVVQIKVQDTGGQAELTVQKEASVGNATLKSVDGQETVKEIVPPAKVAETKSEMLGAPKVEVAPVAVAALEKNEGRWWENEQLKKEEPKKEEPKKEPAKRAVATPNLPRKPDPSIPLRALKKSIRVEDPPVLAIPDEGASVSLGEENLFTWEWWQDCLYDFVVAKDQGMKTVVHTHQTRVNFAKYVPSQPGVFYWSVKRQCRGKVSAWSVSSKFKVR